MIKSNQPPPPQPAEVDLFQEEHQDIEGEGKEWLTTFADLSLLLMVFFVLLFSMSNLDLTRFTDSFQSLKIALAGKNTELATSRVAREDPGALMDQVKIMRQIVENQRKVFSEVQYYQNTKGMKGVVGAHFDKGIITLNVPSDVMFAPGQVELTPRGREIIGNLKDFFIKHRDQNINIRGFTDDVKPTGRSRFKDNWEISAMRAVNVLRFLLELGLEPKRMTATGLADLQPLVPNSSKANRQKNRRIEFVLEKKVGGS